jgi:transcriptional regulator with XRE-family HTH domain
MRRQMRPRISQEDLCGRVARYGVTLTRTQIAKLESGTRPVFDYEVLAIAKALKIPIERLYAK